MDLILRNGTVVNAHETFVGDVGIEGGRIKRVGFDLGPAKKEVDCAGKFLFPGGVDVHTHADIVLSGLQSADDFYSATAAAACGGITTIIDYAFPEPGQSVMGGIQAWIKKATPKVVIDYGLHAVIFEPTDRNIAEMKDAVAEGHTSFKIFTTDLGKFEQFGAQYLKVMREAGRLGAMVNIHCEDQCCLDYLAAEFKAANKTGPENFSASRPPIAEGLAASRVLRMTQLADVPAYLVHLSHEEGLKPLNEARARGQTVYGETRPIYLKFSEKKLLGKDARLFVSWPPLRSEDQMDILWQGLQSGVLQTVATDHLGWARDKKAVGTFVHELLPGASHLQTLLPLLYSDGVRKGKITAQKFVEVSSANPARLFGMYPRKGVIQPGADADIAVFDAEKTVEIRLEDMKSRQDFEIYEGEKFTGWPVMTLSRGEIIVEDNVVKAAPGRGRLIKRKLHSEL